MLEHTSFPTTAFSYLPSYIPPLVKAVTKYTFRTSAREAATLLQDVVNSGTPEDVAGKITGNPMRRRRRRSFS